MIKPDYRVEELEKTDSIKVASSVLIALTALSGALLTWEASRVNGRAAALDAEALKAALHEATTEISIASDVMFHQNAFLAYKLHLLVSRVIKRQAQADPTLPGSVFDDWQREIMRANVFRGMVDQDYLDRGEVGEEERFDPGRFHDAYRAEAASQKALDPAPFVARAEAERRRAGRLFRLNVLLSGALFLLTLGLKVEGRTRKEWVLAGGALYVSALILGLWQVVR